MAIKLNNITFKQLQETWEFKLHSGKILELWKEFISTLPSDLTTQLEDSNYTLYNADENVKMMMKRGQIAFVFEIPYEPQDLQERFNKYASEFIIVTNLIS